MNAISTMNEFLPVEHYVPHRDAMLLIDRLTHADHEGATARVTVPRDGLFVQDAGMPVWVGLEYMAQTVAAWAGWKARQAGQDVKLGFLLGTRKFEGHCAFFAPGSDLNIHVRSELVGDNGLGMFACDIHDAEGVLLAQARVSVYEPEDGTAYIRAIENQGESDKNE